MYTVERLITRVDDPPIRGVETNSVKRVLRWCDATATARCLKRAAERLMRRNPSFSCVNECVCAFHSSLRTTPPYSVEHVGSVSTFAVRPNRPKWPGCYDSMTKVWRGVWFNNSNSKIGLEFGLEFAIISMQNLKPWNSSRCFVYDENDRTRRCGVSARGKSSTRVRARLWT